MTTDHYWPGSMTWQEITERIRAWSDGPISRDEAYEVAQISGMLGVFGFPEGSQFREEKESIKRYESPFGPHQPLNAASLNTLEDYLCSLPAEQHYQRHGPFVNEVTPVTASFFNGIEQFLGQMEGYEHIGPFVNGCLPSISDGIRHIDIYLRRLSGDETPEWNYEPNKIDIDLTLRLLPKQPQYEQPIVEYDYDR